MKLKLPETTLSDVRCGYLYANTKKLVLLHEAHHAKAGRVEWATIHDTDIKCDFAGRIVLHRGGAIRIALTATRVMAKEASPNGGSENTKKLGISVGYVSFQLGPNQYQDSIHFNLMDGLISSDFTYQPENTEDIAADCTYWCGMRVAS